MQAHREKHNLRRKGASNRVKGHQPGVSAHGRSAAHSAERTSGRRRRSKNDRAHDKIPGTGENSRMEAAAERIPTPTSAEFDRIIEIKSQALLEETPEAAAEKITDVILPAMAGFIIAADYGLYLWLGSVYLLTNLIMKMEDEPDHLAAMKRAAGISEDVEVRAGNKPFMKVLQALGPLPAEDGSGSRRRAQDRYSNYHLALEAAQEQGLFAKHLLDRLVNDRGIEKLVEQRRAAAKKKSQGEVGGDANYSQARSQRRKQAREEKEGVEREFATSKGSGASRRGKQGQQHADGSQADLPFGEGKLDDADLSVAVGEDVRPLFAKPGKFLTVTHVAGSGRHHLVVRYAQPLPRHGYDNDGEALTAMIRSLRK